MKIFLREQLDTFTKQPTYLRERNM
jgi:hypothetical protein